MALKLALTTPWVRDRLRGDPDEAMAVEARRLTTPVEGTLRLTARSSRGPYLAIVNTATSDFDGYRATGANVLVAADVAIGMAEAAA
jgi:hypothetical protein